MIRVGAEGALPPGFAAPRSILGKMKDGIVARNGWIECEEDGGGWVHARRLPSRMDLSVCVAVAARPGRRLARAIRQDMWRALRDLRGFSPVVRVTAAGDVAQVTAGGQIDAAWPRAATEARLAALLADPAHVARWRAWAGVMLLGLLPFSAMAQVVAPVPPPEVVAGAPSGLALVLQEVLVEPQAEGAPWVRFRLVAPDLGTVDFAQVEADFPWLCERFALPRLAQDGQVAAQVIISMASEPVPFGETVPEVIQYFEVFRPVSEPGGDRCIWEVF